MKCKKYDDPMDEIYAIRRRISARYGHDSHRYFRAMVEKQRERVRQGQVFWGFNAEGKLAPLPPEAILNRPVDNFFQKPVRDLSSPCV